MFLHDICPSHESCQTPPFPPGDTALAPMSPSTTPPDTQHRKLYLQKPYFSLGVLHVHHHHPPRVSCPSSWPSGNPAPPLAAQSFELAGHPESPFPKSSGVTSSAAFLPTCHTGDISMPLKLCLPEPAVATLSLSHTLTLHLRTQM